MIPASLGFRVWGGLYDQGCGGQERLGVQRVVIPHKVHAASCDVVGSEHVDLMQTAETRSIGA